MNNIVVGCPIRHREWILDHWFAHIEDACLYAGKVPRYVFAVDRGEQKLIQVMNWWMRHKGREITVVAMEEEPHEDVRDWNHQRFEHMVYLRNNLLLAVRNYLNSPSLFWSVDSDMLVHHQTLKNAIECLEDYDAVGSKAYLTEKGTNAPNYGMFLPSGGFRRPDSANVFKVDILMAIKLMTPKAYNVNYRFNSQGEDLGWSKAAVEAGCRLGWDGRIVNKHVMRKELLHEFDARCGY